MAGQQQQAGKRSSVAPDTWGSVPSEERQRELEDLFVRQQQWVERTPEPRDVDKSIFKGLRLTGADVFWLASRSLAGSLGVQAIDGQMERLRVAQGDPWLSLTVRLDTLHLERANLSVALLAGANLRGACLAGTTLVGAHLERASLFEVRLEGARLTEAHLEGADLSQAHLEGRTYQAEDPSYQHVRQWADDFPLVLAPADLSRAVFDSATNLKDATLGTPAQGYVRVADVRWGGVNLAVMRDWPTEMRLGDERTAWAWRRPVRNFAPSASGGGRKLSRKERAEARRKQEQAWQYQLVRMEEERLDLFRAAVRANRQLASALRDQGMNEEADRFAYRAQVCQREVFRLRRQRARTGFSRVLDLLSGYGYQPGKTLGWYLAVLGVFALAYLGATNGALPFRLPPSQMRPLQWYEALVLSVSSFHGRGFFRPVQSLGDPVAILAAAEAVLGLFIEISFIATFTQRYFGK